MCNNPSRSYPVWFSSTRLGNVVRAFDESTLDSAVVVVAVVVVVRPPAPREWESIHFRRDKRRLRVPAVTELE